MTDPLLLDIQKLTISFDQGNGEKQPVVKDFSMQIPQRKTVALVGESGSGKSVTALSILKLLASPPAEYTSGQILYHDQNLLSLSEKEMRQIRGDKISMIFQEPMTSLNPLHTVERQISESLHLHKGYYGEKAQQRVIELLDLVGIPEPHRRLKNYPHELSGGQKQRVMIAMALANEPELLIADEPTTALDVTVQKQVLELLADLQKKMGMSILLITHDLNIVRRYAEQVVVMYKGEKIESGPTEEIFQHPKETYTQTLLNANPEGKPIPVDDSSPPLLEARQMNIWFPIKKNFWGKTKEVYKAVNNVSLKVAEGETLGIVGESGSGKTTLGLALIKLLSSQGEIHFCNEAIHTLNQKQFRPFRSDIQIVFQDPYGSLSPRMSVSEIIAEGLGIHQPKNSDKHEQAIIQVMQEVGLDPGIRHRYPHEFSGGQRQRIAIARALVLQPKLIILDEPTSALDRTVQKQVVELLRSIQSKYKISYLFISHDLAVVRSLSHRIMVMRNGQVVESGDCESIFTNPKEAYTKALIEAAFLDKTV
jgi:microcin C transport system ATP-binding protein